MKNFWEGPNGRICPLIIAFGVDTFTEAVKRAMNLEKTLSITLVPRRVKRSKGPLILNMVRVKGIRKDSLKTWVIEDNLLGIARVPILSLVIRSLALVVVNFMMDKIVMGSRFALLVSNSNTLLEIAQVLRAQVPLSHLKLQRVMTMGRRCKVECIP